MAYTLHKNEVVLVKIDYANIAVGAAGGPVTVTVKYTATLVGPKKMVALLPSPTVIVVREEKLHATQEELARSLELRPEDM